MISKDSGIFALRVKGLVVASIMMFAGAFPLEGKADTSAVVRKVIVKGNQRIESDTVRSNLLLQEGDVFDDRRIDRSLKSLFATGYFADISITRQEDSLIITVIENPVINRIAFEGNLRIDDDILKNEVVLKPRVVFTRTKVQTDVKRILDVYTVNGRFAANVNPKIIRLPQNRIDLVFEIDEGPLTKVKSIRFVGNTKFDDGDLRAIIKTKEAIWYRFLSSNDTYDPNSLKIDRELLRQHYLSEGYADFRASSAIAELAPNRKAFLITFSLHEGKRYKFGDINVSSGIRGLDGSHLEALLEFKKGNWYDSTQVEDALQKVTDEIGNRGYAFVVVRPKIERNHAASEVNLTLNVREGPRVFVEKIDITGNVRTIDSVIRREFRVVEGDAFNAGKLRRSRQRISDLNYFKKVELKRQPGSTRDKAVIKVDVEEKSTGSLNLGFGYSTSAGPLIDVTLRERNLLGQGQSLSAAFTLAAEKSSLNLSFTQPYFMERDISTGFDLFHTRRDLQDSRSFDSQNTGFGIRAGYPLSTELRQSWRYGFEISEIENVASAASTLIKQQEGTRHLSTIRHGLMYDVRDSKLFPTEGFVTRLTNALAGLGGNVFYLRNVISAAQYYSPAKDWVLSTSARAGHIQGLGQDVQIADRFFLGGDSLRGFAGAGVGPRDKTTQDSLGGEWVYNGSVQLRMPLGLPSELGISGRLFSDFGSIGDINPTNSNVFDSGSIRASIGAGMGWISPFGPVNVDFGIPILKESADVEEIFRLNFGTRF